MEGEEMEDEEMKKLKKYEAHKWNNFPQNSIDSSLDISRHQPADESEIKINQSYSSNELDGELLEMLHKKLIDDPETQSFEDFDEKLLEHLQTQYGKKSEQEEENQASDEKELWQDLLDREQNFHDGKELFSRDSESFRENIEGLYLTLEADITCARFRAEQRLNSIYSRTYDFVVTLDSSFSVFGENTNLRKAVFDVCVFMGLYMFLHNTKRIQGVSSETFVYEHSPLKYNEKESASYFDIKRRKKDTDKADIYSRNKCLESEAVKIRKRIQRRLQENRVYYPRAGSKILPKDSIHEWLLTYEVENVTSNPNNPDSLNVEATYKRIRKLEKALIGVCRAVKSPKNEEYEEQLKKSYDNYYRELQKVKYKDYLEICKFFLEHIQKDPTHYGVNLYRFEKELALYEHVSEVKQLLASKSESEKEMIVDKYIILNNICFTKVRSEFFQHNQVTKLVQNFYHFLTIFIKLSRLFVDKFIEDGVLGKDWESLFLEKSNSMATEVLYDPTEIDYSINSESESQKMFEIALLAPVYNQVCCALVQWKYSVDFTQLSE